VNGVAPGAIMARGRVLGRPHAPAHRFAHLAQAHGDPDDVARAVLFDRGSTVRYGQIIAVDGGRSINL